MIALSSPQSIALRLRAAFIPAMTAALVFGAHPVLRAATEADADTVNLELEVEALTALNDLHLNTDQVTAIKGMISDTAGKLSDPPAPISAGHKTALQTMRTTLLGKDQKKIEDAEDKLDEFEDKQDPDSEPDVDQTEPAKEKAASLLKILSPAQVAHYISENSDDVHDPAQGLLDAVHHAQGMSDDDFDTLQDDTSDDVRVLLAGPHPGKPPQVGMKVKHLLDRCAPLVRGRLQNPSGQAASGRDEGQAPAGPRAPLVRGRLQNAAVIAGRRGPSLLFLRLRLARFFNGDRGIARSDRLPATLDGK